MPQRISLGKLKNDYHGNEMFKDLDVLTVSFFLVQSVISSPNSLRRHAKLSTPSRQPVYQLFTIPVDVTDLESFIPHQPLKHAKNSTHLIYLKMPEEVCNHCQRHNGDWLEIEEKVITIGSSSEPNMKWHKLKFTWSAKDVWNNQLHV